MSKVRDKRSRCSSRARRDSGSAPEREPPPNCDALPWREKLVSGPITFRRWDGMTGMQERPPACRRARSFECKRFEYPSISGLILRNGELIPRLVVRTSCFECLGSTNVLVRMSWFECLGSNVLVRMSWFKCLGSNVLVQMSWFKCLGSNLAAAARVQWAFKYDVRGSRRQRRGTMVPRLHQPGRRRFIFAHS